MYVNAMMGVFARKRLGLGSAQRGKPKDLRPKASNLVTLRWTKCRYCKELFDFLRPKSVFAKKYLYTILLLPYITVFYCLILL